MKREYKTSASARAASKRWRKNHPKEARASVRKWQTEDPERCLAANRKWRKENSESIRASRRKYLYGLSDQAYQKFFEDGCWLCRESFEGDYIPHVEHSHETNEVRGLAHKECNWGIGMAKDNPVLLRKWADSLERIGGK
jgi:hypothetical protein